MGKRFKRWEAGCVDTPRDYGELSSILLANRRYEPVPRLEYGDHGLERAIACLTDAIEKGKRLALYADYDVDGTMSCVSWIWFLKAIGYTNYVHYIPCRFKEGYGVNLAAVRRLIEEERAEVIVTMDTGITANEEAAFCRSRGVDFICTDHHLIQMDRMPDCVVVNPKLHPDPVYRELCGCGVTFVLLRRLSQKFSVPRELWDDLLALTGMATICDVVPLNGVNHKLAQLGVEALRRSRRPVLLRLRQAAAVGGRMDEKDVGFRLGPRINAVGRLGHADAVVRAFVDEDPEALVGYMSECNDERKRLQAGIVAEAREIARSYGDSPILFLGGPWHCGVVGIAASKIAEEMWRPTWLFERKDGRGKGSARSIGGFDVTEAMASCKELFVKFGGHRAAGGFTFELENEERIRDALARFAESKRALSPDLWESRARYDCEVPGPLVRLPLAAELERMRPFGHGFEEPRFLVKGDVISSTYYRDKRTGEPRHTAVRMNLGGNVQKVVFFGSVHEELEKPGPVSALVTVSRGEFQGNVSLTVSGEDFERGP